MISNSPRTVLAFWKWVELHIVGSHLDLQPLYCRIKERLFELQYNSDHDGTCLVSLYLEDQVESVILVTSNGETVPGQGEINVIQGQAEELWPRLGSVASSSQDTVQVIGSGFRDEFSTCHIQSGPDKFEVKAEVINSERAKCAFPQNKTLSTLDPII